MRPQSDDPGVRRVINQMGDFQTTVDAFLQAMGSRRPAVLAHARRVSTYAVRLATQYGLGADAIEDIRIGALLHDTGKIMIPRRILDKPGRLSELEWEKLRNHPDRGIQLLETLALTPVARDIVLHHHERFDGRGYPDRLTAGQIPWAVRIVSVMDSYDALTSMREYRDPLSPEGARAVIAREAGTRFCPWIVAGFLSLPLELLHAGTTPLGADCYLPEGRPQLSAVSATRAWMHAYAS